jgi:hypothetical protein
VSSNNNILFDFYIELSRLVIGFCVLCLRSLCRWINKILMEFNNIGRTIVVTSKINKIDDIYLTVTMVSHQMSSICNCDMKISDMRKAVLLKIGFLRNNTQNYHNTDSQGCNIYLFPYYCQAELSLKSVCILYRKKLYANQILT